MVAGDDDDHAEDHCAVVPGSPSMQHHESTRGHQQWGWRSRKTVTEARGFHRR